MAARLQKPGGQAASEYLERSHIGPLFGADKAWDRVDFRHGTEDVGSLLVSEQIIGAIAGLGAGSQWMTGLQDISPQSSGLSFLFRNALAEACRFCVAFVRFLEVLPWADPNGVEDP